MKSDTRNYVVVGTFVVAMLTALVLWIAVLAGRTGSTDDYYMLFDNVTGLSAGTQLLYEGYRIGLIESIEPGAAEGRGFRVDVSVTRGWRIPDDSLAQIISPGLLSAFVIDVSAGQSPSALQPGSAIPSIEAANLFAVMSSVAGDLGMLAETSLKPLLDQLAEGAPSILANVDTLTADLRTTLGRIDLILSPENVRRVDRTLAGLETTARNFANTSAELEQTREKVDQLLVAVSTLVETNGAQIDHAIVDLHDTLESVSRHIDTITLNLESSTRNLSEFTQQIRQNPGVIIRGRSGADESAGGS